MCTPCRKAREEQERQKVAALDAQLAELQEEREVSRRQQEEQRAKQVEKDKELDEVRAAQRVAEERLRRLEEDLRVKSREAREAEERDARCSTRTCCSRRDDPHAHCTHCIAIMRRHGSVFTQKHNPGPKTHKQAQCVHPASARRRTSISSARA